MAIGSSIDKMKNATSRAFDKVTNVAQTNTDPDLKIYEKLGQEDFAKIMEAYGVDDVTRYIQEMESRKMIQEGKYGKFSNR